MAGQSLCETPGPAILIQFDLSVGAQVVGVVLVRTASGDLDDALGHRITWRMRPHTDWTSWGMVEPSSQLATRSAT
jgi:hypothetical protein